MSANYSRAAEVPIEDPEAITAAATTPGTRNDPSAEARPEAEGHAIPWVLRVMPDPVDSIAIDWKPSHQRVLAAPILGIVSVDFTPPPPPRPPGVVPTAAVVEPAAATVVETAAAVAVETAAPVRPQPAVNPAASPRRTAPEKRKLTPAEQFRIWIGRPLVASIAFASLLAVGLPVIGATYTRDSANPVAWRNLSPGEVQGKLQYCFASARMPGSMLWCDYGNAVEAGGLAPKKGRIKKTIVQVPYAVAGPVIYDQAPASASGSGAIAPRTEGAPPARGGGGQPGPQPAGGPFPVIQFPAGPMSAIEAKCEAAKQAAQNQSSAYQLNVERQCETAKQAYERMHP